MAALEGRSSVAVGSRATIAGGPTVSEIPLSPAVDQKAIDTDFARMRSGFALVGAVLLLVAPLVFSATNRPSYLTAAVYALVLGLAGISLVILVGYVGQVSLAQFAFMGIGALVVARTAPYTGFWLALPIGGLAAVPLGLVAAL